MTTEGAPENQVGQRLRAIRDGLRPRMSQRRLAPLLDVSHATISKWETGERPIDANMLPHIARVLGCHPCDFFETRPLPIPPAFTEAFEHDGAERMLVEFRALQDLTAHEAAIVADVIASLRRNRPS